MSQDKSQKQPKKFADSKEWGLVCMSRLLGLKYLHYGIWPSDLPPTIYNFFQAQENYTQLLLECISQQAASQLSDCQKQQPEDAGGDADAPRAAAAATAGKRPLRILDVGCGTGGLFLKLIEQGYVVDGVVPSQDMYEEAMQNWQEARSSSKDLPAMANAESRLFCARLEDLDLSEFTNSYDVILFSESFQYIPLKVALNLAAQFMQSPQGRIIICDFFRVRRELDRSMFGGGHYLKDFYDLTQKKKLAIRIDRDITEQISPTIALLENVLRDRVIPAAETVGIFFRSRHRFLAWLFGLLFRKDLRKIRKKYLSGYRTQQVFESYKSYRLFVLEKT